VTVRSRRFVKGCYSSKPNTELLARDFSLYFASFRQAFSDTRVFGHMVF
jgi:hypothetical protein